MRLVEQRIRVAKWLAAMVAIALPLLPAVASAHPLGNFTVNQYSRLDVDRAQVQVLYIVDMAEIPAFQERARIDTNQDQTISDAERDAYLAQETTLLGGNLHLSVNNKPVALAPQSTHLEFPAGQGGLNTLRMTIQFVAALSGVSGASSASYSDTNFDGRIGWREIIVRGSAAAQILDSTAPAQDASQELRNYPRDLLQSPLQQTGATFRFQPAVGAAAPAAQHSAAAQPLPLPAFAGQAADQLAALIAAPSYSWAALLAALVSAFVLGAAHALAPGHGKTIVAAYLVGTRGTTKHALFLGLTTTVTHTAGVFALGLVTLFVSSFVLPEQLYPWLGVASGVMVFVIGASLFSGRLRGLMQRWRPVPAEHDHDMHDFSHGPLSHTHGGSTHMHRPPSDGPITWRGLLALGVSGGLLPCPSALVVLLGAIALGRVQLGLVLIIAFSIGLASVLTAIGVLLVHAGRLFQRIPSRGRLLSVLPVASALIIALAGIGITAQALVQTGLL